MRTSAWICALLLCAARAASAQQRDTAATADSAAKARADSIARADSLLLMKEMQRIRNEPRARTDSTPALTPPTSDGSAATSQGGAAGSTNPRLLPDVSAVGDLVGDISPRGSTQEDGTRLGVREVELAVQAAVDPYFRGDIFLGLSDLEKVAIEQAYLTSTALPYGLEVRLGRFLMPVGKQNTTHRHDLHTIEYPWVIQRLFGGEGLKGTGVWVSEIFAPFGFYQELQLTADDRIGEAPEGLTTVEPVNKRLSGLGYSARLRNYFDLSQSSNLELSATALTGRREQPLDNFPIESAENAVAARQSLFGADVTYRWRPLQQGLYKSFILQAEFMRQVNQRSPSIPPALAPATYAGPTRDYSGAYVFARYQLRRRVFLGSRYDWLQDPEAAGATFTAASGYLEWFPSEFSKLVAGYERLMPTFGGSRDTDRILLQAAFAMGPHKPHPF